MAVEILALLDLKFLILIQYEFRNNSHGTRVLEIIAFSRNVYTLFTIKQNLTNVNRLGGMY